MRIFVTGGAGYIGSHVVKALGIAGHDLLVFDNLSTGHEWAVLYGKLVKGDLSNIPLLNQVMEAFRPEAVIHFAASIQVKESVREPMHYYKNNVANTINLLESMKLAGVRNLVYSSSAAVYGIPEKLPVTENERLKPINPYGRTKEITERVLADVAAAGNSHYISLRYFNVAGADTDGRLGQAYARPPHLITKALKCAKNENEKLYIYGSDYPTPDGTCIRDYIHVDDVAYAHVSALDYIMQTGKSLAMNCGYGHGFTVREIVSMVKKITEVDFSVEEAARRPGDPPVLIADSAQLKSLTGWMPKYDDLEFIINSAWKWDLKLNRRRVSNFSGVLSVR